MVLLNLNPDAPIEVLSEAGASTLPAERQLLVRLNDYGRTGATAIAVDHGASRNALQITLQRTIRVPDNADTNALPPSCGQFPIYRVATYAANMPDDMAAKGGVFIPMYQREALWVQFTASNPFALKMYVGGVNAVSGFPMVENDQTLAKRRRMLDTGKPIQDYMVLPDQPWLDGIVSEDGKIRQFVAKPKGSGFSVEAQVTGEENVGGMQFEIIPLKKNLPASFDVRYEDAEGKVVTRTLVLAERGITAESTWLDVKKVIGQEFDVAPEDLAIKPSDSSLLVRRPTVDFQNTTKLGAVYFPPKFDTLRVHFQKRYEPALYSGMGGGLYRHRMLAEGAVAADADAYSGPLQAQVTGMMSFAPQIAAPAAALAAPPPPPGAAAPEPAPIMFGGATPYSMHYSTHDGASASEKRSKSSAAPQLRSASRSKSAAPPPAPAPPKVKEMGISAGGLIKQTISPDPHGSDVWDVEASVLLNVQILDSESFCAVTGLPPPATPVDAETYASHGYPFFEIWGEEKTGIKGEFGEVKSVAQIEKERAEAKGESVETEDSVPVKVVELHMGSFKSTFRPVEVLQKELEGLSL